MTAILVALIAVAASWTNTFATDVSGRWAVNLVTTDGREAPLIDVTMKQDGDNLAGSCTLQDLDDIFTISGKVKDETLTWQCSSSELRMTFTGTVSRNGNEITGSWNTSAHAEGTFTATKAR